MKSILSLGLITFALTFCGLGERIKQLSGGDGTAANSNTANSSSKASSTEVETAKPTSAQQAIIDSGTETTWDTQGISWRLPAGFKRMSVMKEMLTYGSPG